MAKCPECGKDIDGLRNIQSGENVYDCWINQYGAMDYQHDEFHPDDGTNEWCCPECGATLFRDGQKATKFLRGDEHGKED